jgi:tRNA A-37 threonylcarbamoyl transferase component Bud32
MHDAAITHGDLTTSNILVRQPLAAAGSNAGEAEDGGIVSLADLVMIDFGLGGTQPLAEDKAVDL